MSMSSFCCSPHKQHVASTYSTAAHETSQLLRKDVEFNTLISRLGDRLRGSPRRLHGHLRHPLSARTGFHARCKSELLFCTISLVVSRMCVNARCLFILALSTFCGTNGFPLFCTRVRPIGGTISRRCEILSCSCAATLPLGRGQQLRTDGARRWAGARFDAPFCRCIWLHQVPLGGRRARPRVVVGDACVRLASRVSCSFGVTCRCRSLQQTQA